MKHMLCLILLLASSLSKASIFLRCEEFQNHRKVKVCLADIQSFHETGPKKKSSVILNHGESYRLSQKKICQFQNPQIDVLIKNISTPKPENPLQMDQDFPNLEHPTLLEVSLIKYHNITVPNQKKTNAHDYQIKVKVKISNPPLVELPQKEISFLESGSGVRCIWKLY